MLIRKMTEGRYGLQTLKSFSITRFQIIAAILAFILFTVVFVSVKNSYAESNVSRGGNHVLTIYDGQTEKGILTDATTLRQAFQDNNIELEASDVTEPSLDEELVAATYDVNIYRSRPVAVYDNGAATKVMTPHHSPKQIAAQANIKLNDQDNVSLVSSDNVVLDGAIEKLVIDRATEFDLVLYGKKNTRFTRAETVAEMLKEKDIKLGSKDGMSVKSSDKIKPGMTIKIWRNGKQTVTEQEVVAKPIKQIEDANRKVGYRSVKTPGKNGKKDVTYEIVLKNGKEVSRKKIASTVTQEPVTEVVIVGSKPSFGGDFGEALAKLRSCEGGYGINTGNGYYGAYQFDAGTWASVSSATYGNASPAEEDAAARALYERRGWSPWPSCGAGLPDTYR